MLIFASFIISNIIIIIGVVVVVISSLLIQYFYYVFQQSVCVCLMVLLLFFFSKFFVLSRFWSSNMVVVLLLLFFSHRISSLSHSQIPRIWKQSFWNFFLCKWVLSLFPIIRYVHPSNEFVVVLIVFVLQVYLQFAAFFLLFNFCYRGARDKKKKY